MSSIPDHSDDENEGEIEDIPYPTEIADGAYYQFVGNMVSLFFFQARVKPEKRILKDQSIRSRNKRILYEVRISEDSLLELSVKLMGEIARRGEQRTQKPTHSVTEMRRFASFFIPNFWKLNEEKQQIAVALIQLVIKENIEKITKELKIPTEELRKIMNDD